MCLIHLSGPDSLRLHGDLNHLHVGHRTISLTFKPQEHVSFFFFRKKGERSGTKRRNRGPGHDIRTLALYWELDLRIHESNLDYTQQSRAATRITHAFT